LRQIDVAEMLGHTSADRISHWEKGLAAPGLVNLFKLSIIYDTSPEQLYAELHAGIIKDLKQEPPSKFTPHLAEMRDVCNKPEDRHTYRLEENKKDLR
jgi:hypothetical protein